MLLQHMFIKYFQQRFPEHFASSSAVTATERSAVAARWKAIAPHVLRAASRQLADPDDQHTAP